MAVPPLAFLLLVLFVLHAAATLYMVGLIWFVQVVHYPLFALVGPAQFQAYQMAHMRLTTWVVGPPMLLELAGAVALPLVGLEGLPRWMPWLGLALLAGIWASTAILQVPRHEALLAGGFDAGHHTALVATNGLRAALWTARGLLVGAMMLTLLAR